MAMCGVKKMKENDDRRQKGQMGMKKGKGESGI